MCSVFVVGEGKSYSSNATISTGVSPTVVYICSLFNIFTHKLLFFKHTHTHTLLTLTSGDPKELKLYSCGTHLHL